jgi:DNA-binding NarL/FixJ family response regulator
LSPVTSSFWILVRAPSSIRAYVIPVVRIVIADDEPLFAEALELLLEADERIEVVGRATDGAGAVELSRDLEPDLVLMDLSMPGMDGFSATEQIARDSNVRVLVLTGSDDPADVAKARRAGASGYITKDQIAETLVSAILGAGSGQAGPELP